MKIKDLFSKRDKSWVSDDLTHMLRSLGSLAEWKVCPKITELGSIMYYVLHIN